MELWQMLEDEEERYVNLKAYVRYKVNYFHKNF